MISKIEKSTLVAAASAAESKFAESSVCSLEEDTTAEESFDLELQLKNVEVAIDQMIKSKLEKKERAWKAFSEIDNKRGQIHNDLNELLSAEEGNSGLIEKTTELEKEFLAILLLRDKTYQAVTEMNSLEPQAKYQHVESHMKALQTALAEIQLKIAQTTDEATIKKLTEISSEYAKMIAEDAQGLVNIANDIKYVGYKIKLESIHIRLKSIHELSDYFTAKANTLSMWNSKDSSLGLSALISAANSKIKALQSDQAKTEKELKDVEAEFEKFRASLS